jgi:hypothetical protein
VASLKSLSPWAVALLLGLFLLSQYGYALRVPFINDDYIFLDKTRGASFGSLWEPRELAFHWYRPWSRELHYWSLQRLFGAQELPFHLASWGLALAVLVSYFLLARRIIGQAAAAVATAGVAALAAWAVPLVWIAGVQDLWLLLFALAFLHAWVAGGRALAAVFLALALLSKESAAVLPALATAYGLIVERRRVTDALRATWLTWLMVAAWATFHPVLGGRLWRPLADPPPPGLHPPVLEVALRTLGVPFNLDAAPAPENGWPSVLVVAAIGAVLLAALVLLGTRRGGAHAVVTAGVGSSPTSRSWLFGLAWAALGWAPLMMPTLGWHAYYALLGSLGAWLALAPFLSRRPALAMVLVAGLALLRAARADTPSRDWGSEWYQRRAGSFVDFMRQDLRRLHPTLPPHARLYFVRVPSTVGFLAGDGPALRVWYGDSTLRGGYYPSFQLRPPGAAPGPDLFFRFDSLAGWVPVRTGPEHLEAAQAANPRWLVDHEVLAQTLAMADDWEKARSEYEKLAAADSLRAAFAYNAGVCSEAMGDSSSAAVWYGRAAALPSADAEMRAMARRFARHLPRRARSPGR